MVTPDQDDRQMAIERVIEYMHAHIYEPLSLSTLAEIAAYSPYHFSRVFKEFLGVSPFYYFSALRFQKAKELLIKTHYPIRDICFELGQRSLGTFTTAFTRRVGLSPASFRASLSQMEADLHLLRGMSPIVEKDELKKGTVLSGRVVGQEPVEGIVLLGLFRKVVPEEMPSYVKIMNRFGEFQFTGIKPGTYFLKAIVISDDMSPTDILLPKNTWGAIRESALIVNESIPRWEGLELVLERQKWTDRPVLVSLPLLLQKYLHQIEIRSNR